MAWPKRQASMQKLPALSGEAPPRFAPEDVEVQLLSPAIPCIIDEHENMCGMSDDHRGIGAAAHGAAGHACKKGPS
eukprot:2704223-Pleurochrysis_carterae.AAC.1